MPVFTNPAMSFIELYAVLGGKEYSASIPILPDKPVGRPYDEEDSGERAINIESRKDAFMAETSRLRDNVDRIFGEIEDIVLDQREGGEAGTGECTAIPLIDPQREEKRDAEVRRIKRALDMAKEHLGEVNEEIEALCNDIRQE